MSGKNGTRNCSIGGCENTGRIRRGWCSKHYTRWRKHGDPLKTVNMIDQSLKERLLARRQIMPNGCWEWAGYVNEDGYGVITYEGKQVKVHRASWQEHNGPIPDGMQALHKCDNPPCFNPECLFLGTNTDNMVDMVKKGRNASTKGENNGNSKLTETLVRWVRKVVAEGSYSQKEIAVKLNVTQTVVSGIVLNKSWKHI